MPVTTTNKFVVMIYKKCYMIEALVNNVNIAMTSVETPANEK